jgi:large subunit ribosomal protein L10
MNRTDKEQLVSELSGRIDKAKALYFTDFTGLNVKRMTELRRRLRKAGVDYVVIKNTLALRAVNQSGLTTEPLKGPTGVVVSQDPVVAAKLISDFARENDQRPTVKSGLFEGQLLTQAQVKKLASMPSREQMLADLGASMQAPLSMFLGVMNSLLTNFAGAVEALKQQRAET